MTTTMMQALRLTEWESDPVLTEVPVPAPQGPEVLVEVAAAGLCRTDLHIMSSPPGAYPYALPFTLGHESAGRVAALGPEASGVHVGDPVVVYSRWGCGTCWQCARGADNACMRTHRGPHGGGLGRDGGLAEYLLVPSARYLVPTPGLAPVRAAPLADAALTSYHAVKLSLAQLHSESTAVVLGVGGLGHMAVQVLKAITPARIIAVDLRSAALEMARAAGADAIVSAAGLTAEHLRAETDPDGVSVVLDFVGNDATLALASGSVAQGGDVTFVGRGGGELRVAPGLIPYETTVRMPTWGTVAELAEVVALAADGKIHSEAEVYELDDAVSAYGKLRDGEVLGRAVVVPGT
ncbi:MAG: NAD(P)-dependent alcohol dehydrogenase [Solirubrobacterales bacterium]|nr:NAD(P)-dependent alcohol dehydrogenase [Solirubrobacterales bacterium]